MQKINKTQNKPKRILNKFMSFVYSLKIFIFKLFFKNNYKNNIEKQPYPVWNRKQYFKQINKDYADLSNPFIYYKMIINKLDDLEELSIHPLNEFFTEHEQKDKAIIGIRHDIDSDPVTAVRCARYLAHKGICGSFYLLHTSPYYGCFSENKFYRSKHIEGWLKQLIVSGCEIGLHNDCMHIYKNLNLDGANYLKQEIDWMRKIGAKISGTAAHNSGPVYGAENFEIFKNFVLWDRKVFTNDKQNIPLGRISMDKMNLSYEANFAYPKKINEFNRNDAEKFYNTPKDSDVRSKSWMKRYLNQNPAMNTKIDYNIWLVGRDMWIVSCNQTGSIFHFNVGFDFITEFIQRIEKKSRTIFMIHPAYVRG